VLGSSRAAGGAGLVAALLALAILVLAGHAQASGAPSHTRLELFFVQQAERAVLTPRRRGGYQLRLRGAGARATWFSDRPRRDTGQIATRALVARFGRGGDFRRTPPNAALEGVTARGTQVTVVLELTRARRTSRGLIYRAKVLRRPTGDLGHLRARHRRPAGRLVLRGASLLIDDTDQRVVNGCVIVPYTTCGSFDFSGADLSGADLNGAVMPSSKFSGADLSGARLRGADLSGSNLQKAKLRNADLSGVGLQNANLQRAEIDGAQIPFGHFSGADLSWASLHGATLEHAELGGAELAGADLGEADLVGATLSGANLADANLADAKLGAANLERASLTRANLTRASLWNAGVVGTDFSFALLDGARANVNGGSGRDDAAIFERASLVGAILDPDPRGPYGNGRLRYANFEGATLTDASLRGTDLQGAQLVSARAPRALFDGANLDGATIGTSRSGATQPASRSPSTVRRPSLLMCSITRSPGDP